MKKGIKSILSVVVVMAVGLTGTVQAQDTKREGWSPQAKGAVIGAGTGAAAGAIIHKRNRVVGGVVGGAVGGGAGYVIGKSIDNKQKARAAEEARIAAANRAAAERAEANRIAMARREAAPAPAKQAAVTRTAPAAPVYNGLVASNGNGVYSAGTTSETYVMNSVYLPNYDYGDRTKPYHTSEYRRKSW